MPQPIHENSSTRQAPQRPWRAPLAIGAVALVLTAAALRVPVGAFDDAGLKAKAASLARRQPLERLNLLIGEWRGVGQPRRQSNKDAWSEKAAWAWDFQSDPPAIVQQVVDGKLLQQARLSFDPQTQQYVLATTAPDGAKVVYRGAWNDEQLVLTAPPTEGGPSRRITLTPRSDIRVIVLHEATEPGRDVFFRVAEVGYTRAGARLAGPGGGQPQCVVTGGLGTIEVRHQGKTYYVCCSGCRQAFEDDPEGVLKEYRERLERERQPPAP